MTTSPQPALLRLGGATGLGMVVATYGYVIHKGTSVPAGASGYAPGCLFFHLDGTPPDDLLYFNIGDNESCNFISVNSLVALESGSLSVLATEIGCVMNSEAAASANVSALNDFFDTLENPASVGRPELVIPHGRLYVDSEILLSAKTGVRVCGVGTGLSYRIGNSFFDSSGVGGPESIIVNVSDDAAGSVFLVQGVGTEICRLKIQGRDLPTHDTSGTGTKCGYGIRVAGDDDPPTGKNHFHDLTFVELGSHAFYYPASPGNNHGDTTDYGKMILQGCLGVMKCENYNSIGHNFYGFIEFAGDGISGSHIGWDMYSGGDLNVAHVHWNAHGGTVLTLHSGSYSPNNNFYNFDNLRIELVEAVNGLTNMCLLDASESSNNDYPFHIRFRGSITGFSGHDYTPDNLLKFKTSPTFQNLDVSHDMAVTYYGANKTDRNTNRATFAAFNSYRSPATPYHDNEV